MTGEGVTVDAAETACPDQALTEGDLFFVDLAQIIAAAVPVFLKEGSCERLDELVLVLRHARLHVGSSCAAFEEHAAEPVAAQLRADAFKGGGDPPFIAEVCVV